MFVVSGALVLVVTMVAGCSGGESGSGPQPAASSGGPAPSEVSVVADPIDRGSLTGVMAYSAVSDGAAADDVFVVDLSGGRPVRLTDGPEREYDPALSPDGSLVAYRRNPRADSDDADIWVMAVDGSGKRNLTHAPELANWAPAWTADGRIVFSRKGSGGDLELWSMAPDGSGQRQLAEGWCEYASPAPDATRYACSTPVNGRYDIVLVDEAGRRESLTTTPESEFGAAWSPDGDWIVFSRDLGDRWELLRIRPDGTDEQVLASEGVFATWGPRGELAWSGLGGLNIARPDGSGPVVLDLPADHPSWAAGPG